MKDSKHNEDLKFKEITHDSGYILTIKEWTDMVDIGAFVDYNGYGYLATDFEESNIKILPSQAIDGRYTFPEWATNVIWYSR